MRTKKMVNLIVATFMLMGVLLAGCAPKATPTAEPTATTVAKPVATAIPQPTEKPAGATGQVVLVMTGLDAARTLHPSHSSFGIPSAIKRLVVQPLIGSSSQDGSTIPLLAKDWEVSADKSTITFYLREDVKFHNGDVMDADDVKATLDFIRNDDLATEANAPKLKAMVEEITVVDPLTVEIRLAAPDVTVFTIISRFGIVPKEMVEECPDSQACLWGSMPVGAGPYRIVAHEGDDITLEWFPDYWGEPAKIAKAFLKAAGDANAVGTALRTGESDIAEYAAATMAGLEAQGFMVESEAANINRTFRWTLANPIFADKKVREALVYATNRDAIVQGVYAGIAEVSGDQPLSSSDRFYNPNIEPRPYDPEKAKSLLAEAGWVMNAGTGVSEKDGQPFSIEVGANPGPDLQVALMLQQDWAEVGVEVEIVQLPDFASLKEYCSQGGAIVNGGGQHADPGSSLAVYYGYTHWGVRWTTPHDEILQMVLDANAEFDPAKRQKMMWDFAEVLSEELPELFLVNTYQGVVWNPKLQGVKVAPWWTPGFLYHINEWYWAE